MENQNLERATQQINIWETLKVEEQEENYEHIGNLGAGAQGIVKKIRSKKDGKVYAMKIIYEYLTDNERYRKFSLREAMLLKEFTHKNVIKVHDYFKTRDEQLCIIMDYEESYDLYKLVFKIQNVQRDHPNLAKEIYTQHEGNFYLKENFIINVII